MEASALAAFQPTSIEQAVKFAEVLARSTLLPEPLRGKPGDVLVTIITGQELGLTAMQAIRGMHVVKGKAILSADLAVALVKRHPECVYFKLTSSTDTVATYETERKGEGKTVMSFTIEQARQARLGGDNWQKYPAAMLRARAATALARAVYPDMMLGVYDEDEGREISGEKDITPPKRGLDSIPTKAAPLPPEPKAELPAKAQAPVQEIDGDLAAKIMEAEAEVAKRPDSKIAKKKLEHLQGEMAKRRGRVIDVEPGQTEEEAEAMMEPPPVGDEDRPWGDHVKTEGA